MNEPSKEWFSGAIWLVQQRPEIEAVEWYSEVAILRLRLRSEFWYPIISGKAMRGESQSVRERDASLINCVDPLGHEAAGDLRFTRAELLARDLQTQGAGGSADAAHGDTAVAAPSGSAHAISAQPPAPSDIREVATKVSRSEARRLEMVRAAKLGLEGVETWPR